MAKSKDPQDAGEKKLTPLPGPIAMRLALELTQPKHRTDEFSTVRITNGAGGAYHTDNPAMMIGLVVQVCEKWLQTHVPQFNPPSGQFLAAQLNAHGGNVGEFRKGILDPKQNLGTWIAYGRRILCYYILGWNDGLKIPDSQPTHVDDAIWRAWERVNKVFFDDAEAGIPRFFRGRRRAWSGAWSELELYYELERLGLHSKFCDEKCDLIMVSGGRKFPQTDQRWSPHDAQTNHIADVTRLILEQGVQCRFIFPSQEVLTPANSYIEFANSVDSRFVSTKQLDAIRVGAQYTNFLTPAIQFAYLRAGSNESLLILRGLQGSAASDREPITSAGTPLELAQFLEWIKPLNLEPSTGKGVEAEGSIDSSSSSGQADLTGDLNKDITTKPSPGTPAEL